MTWQPIETAPKDSTTIDIWSAKYGRLTNYYRVDMSANNIFIAMRRKISDFLSNEAKL
jgi:hypothetical protein